MKKKTSLPLLKQRILSPLLPYIVEVEEGEKITSHLSLKKKPSKDKSLPLFFFSKAHNHKKRQKRLTLSSSVHRIQGEQRFHDLDCPSVARKAQLSTP